MKAETLNVNKPITYYEYLQSEQWKKKKSFAIKYYHNQCTVCGTKQSLNVHHKRYNHIFNEPIEDLSVLCVRDHHLHHDHLKEMEVAQMNDIRELSEKWRMLQTAEQMRERAKYYVENPEQLIAMNDNLLNQLRTNRLRREGLDG